MLAAGCLLCWASAALAQNVDDFQPQPAAARSARYAVEGLALGTRIGFDSPAYREYKCAPSDQFDGFTWCQKTHREGGRRWSFETKYSMLHSRDGTIVYVNRYQRPAIVRPDEAESEIQNYSRRLGESPRVTRMPSRSGIHNAVLAAWGGIELEALDDHSLKSLAEGTSPKKGLLIDFIGDLTRSAQEGLPVYRIAGGAGFVWVAGFDHKGRGVLRFAAVDASTLQPGSLAVGRPSASPNDQRPPRLQNETSSDTRADAGTVARLQTELSTVLKAKAGAELAAQKARIDA